MFAFLASPINATHIRAMLAHCSHLYCENSLIRLDAHLYVDKSTRQIYKNKKFLFLPPKLRQIFWLLFDNRNKLVSHYTVVEMIDNTMSLDSLRMAIVRLRKLLANKELIISIPRDGYMLVCRCDDEKA